MEISNEFTVREKDIDLFHHMNYKRYIEFLKKSVQIGLKQVDCRFNKWQKEIWLLFC